MICLERIISLVIGYLFGSLLPAELVSRHYTGKSVREIGSGNPGMTNVLTNIGTVPGALVLGGDILKTCLAMGLSFLCFGRTIGKLCVHYAGLGTVLGHDFPFRRVFEGGKGVTVTCSWTILGFGLWGILCELAGAATVFLTGWLPLGALVVGAAPIPMIFRLGGLEVGLLACISCAVMLGKQWDGLKRIARGEEQTRFKLVNRHAEHNGKA